jgi:hypothetical protein
MCAVMLADDALGPVIPRAPIHTDPQVTVLVLLQEALQLDAVQRPVAVLRHSHDLYKKKTCVGPPGLVYLDEMSRCMQEAKTNFRKFCCQTTRRQSICTSQPGASRQGRMLEWCSWGPTNTTQRFTSSAGGMCNPRICTSCDRHEVRLSHRVAYS